MFQRRTLFVLGAGSSNEVNMPLGTDLAKMIANKLDIQFDGGALVGDGDRDLFEEFSECNPGEIGAYVRAGLRVRDGIQLSSSVDDFLETHCANPYLIRYCKAAIIKSILEAEAESSLMYERSDTDPALNYHLISDTWFVKFMRTLSRGVRVADVQNIFKNVVFVNFNYDRCLEYFLLLALRAQFGLNDTDASQILSTLKILRPYGKVGPLTTLWSSNEVRFGAPKKSSMMKHTDLIDQIKTFSECLSEETDLADIRAEVAKAQCLVFLGFAFHDQNIRILKPNGPMNQIHVFATALGMSDDDANFTTGQIMRFFDNPTKGLIRVKNKLTCNGLFDHYGHSIAG